MGLLKYKGYTGSVEYSDEDKCLFGKVQGLHGTLISYEGTTIEEITEDFQEAVDDYLVSCEERGIAPAKPYSGKLVLRAVRTSWASSCGSLGCRNNNKRLHQQRRIK